jgi:hypothetical protein
VSNDKGPAPGGDPPRKRIGPAGEPDRPEADSDDDSIQATRRNGAVTRTTLRRIGTAYCPACDWWLEGTNALAQGSYHAEVTGHVVDCTYSASYRYEAVTS